MESRYEEATEQIYHRFIYCLPPEELAPSRLMMNLLEAHWYYEDHIKDHLHLKSLTFNEFVNLIRRYYPYMAPGLTTDQLLSQYSQYRSEIPCRGAIILNPEMNKVVLVSNYNCTVYGFPKGKINEAETDEDCAVREVYEEIGLDISEKLNSSDYIDYQDGNCHIRLYIIQGVSENYEFRTHTNKEIGMIEWVKLDDIPSKKKKSDVFNKKMYFKNIHPFLGELRRWIASRSQPVKEFVIKEYIPEYHFDYFKALKNFKLDQEKISNMLDSYFPELVSTL
jgi:8-oxo-dGTP pyrophosphatase MutT (NUDIX family)